jgi:CRP/FNR family cyclic AMP-dependent transcriptional regulator
MKFFELFQNWENLEEHNAQSVIFSAGETSEVLYFILSGEIELTLNGESLGIEHKGGVIGEMAMIPSATQSATATALGAVRLARIDHDQLKKMASASTEFSLHVMSVLANRLKAVDQYISTHFNQTE